MKMIQANEIHVITIRRNKKICVYFKSEAWANKLFNLLKDALPMDCDLNLKSHVVTPAVFADCSEGHVCNVGGCEHFLSIDGALYSAMTEGNPVGLNGYRCHFKFISAQLDRIITKLEDLV